MNKKMYYLVCLVILLFIPINSKQQVKLDTENPIVGGFRHMGPVLDLYHGEKYIMSVFNNTDTIDIEYYGWDQECPIWKFSISQPVQVQNGFVFETECQEGIYKITCNDITLFYTSYGAKVTIMYR